MQMFFFFCDNSSLCTLRWLANEEHRLCKLQIYMYSVCISMVFSVRCADSDNEKENRKKHKKLRNEPNLYYCFCNFVLTKQRRHRETSHLSLSVVLSIK